MRAVKDKNHTTVTGLILAGGRSSRMGRDKATLIYRGESFLDRAHNLLGTLGVGRIVVLGHAADRATGEPFPGPARAITRFLSAETAPCDILVIPVDMPCLTPAVLERLLARKNGAYFRDLYLPFYAPRTAQDPELTHTGWHPARMRELVERWRLEALNVPEGGEFALTGVNTPQELAHMEAVTKLNIQP